MEIRILDELKSKDYFSPDYKLIKPIRYGITYQGKWADGDDWYSVEIIDAPSLIYMFYFDEDEIINYVIDGLMMHYETLVKGSSISDDKLSTQMLALKNFLKEHIQEL